MVSERQFTLLSRLVPFCGFPPDKEQLIYDLAHSTKLDGFASNRLVDSVVNIEKQKWIERMGVEGFRESDLRAYEKDLQNIIDEYLPKE